VASANPYVYTPTPLIHPRKWGKKERGVLRVSAVGTSSPQKLLEAVTALFVKDLATKYLENSRRESSDILTCVAHKFACKFTLNLQNLSVNTRDSTRRSR